MTVAPNKALNEPAHNSNVNSWDTPLNANFQNLDDWAGTVQTFNLTGVSGTINVTASSYAGAYPANTASYIPQLWSLSGTPVGNVTLLLPSTVGGMWMIKNNTGGNFNVNFGLSGGGNTIGVAQGTNQIVWANASSGFVDYAQTSLTSISSNTQIIFNDSGALAGDPNFTWSPQAGSTAGSLGVTGNITFTAASVGTHNAGIVFSDGSYQSSAPATMPSGVVLPFAGSSVPSGGWLWCNGQVVSQSTYPNLYAAIGSTYNNSPGAGNFNVPDMRCYAPFGRDNMGAAGVTGRINNTDCGIVGTTLGATGGVDAVTLTTPQIPSHTHVANALLSSNTGSDAGAAATTGTLSAVATASTGGGTSHSNQPPTIILNYIIKT